MPDVVYRPLAEPGVTVDFHLLHRATETDPAVSAFLLAAAAPEPAFGPP